MGFGLIVCVVFELVVFDSLMMLNVVVCVVVVSRVRVLPLVLFTYSGVLFVSLRVAGFGNRFMGVVLICWLFC